MQVDQKFDCKHAALLLFNIIQNENGSVVELVFVAS